MNSGDEVVGYACTAGNASCRAFLFTGVAAINLGSLGGNSVANDINDQGQAAGSSYLAGSSAQHAFLHTGGVLQDLGTLGGTSSEAFGINEHAHVVGTAQIAGGAARAFLWRNGAMIDLNAVLPARSGWVLQSANGISDGGQIIGTGTLNGVSRAFLLTPPADLAVHAFGGSTNADSNLPRGAEVGRTIRFVLTPDHHSDQGHSLYGARLTHTLTGPIKLVDVAPHRDSDRCIVTPKVIACELWPAWCWP